MKEQNYEVIAEVFKVIRANQHEKPKEIIRMLKEHLPNVSNEELILAIEYLKKR